MEHYKIHTSVYDLKLPLYMLKLQQSYQDFWLISDTIYKMMVKELLSGDENDIKKKKATSDLNQIESTKVTSRRQRHPR